MNTGVNVVHQGLGHAPAWAGGRTTRNLRYATARGGRRLPRSRVACLALAFAALLALAPALVGCSAPGTSGALSDTGQPIMIVIANQPVYGTTNCTGDALAQVAAGDNVVDLRTTGTNCDEVVYLQNGAYGGLGYLPIYGMRRAAGGVRCEADVDCHLRAGPDTTYPILGALPPGAGAKGYGTAQTNAIITDGSNYDWWEVVDPSSGQRADIFGPNCQAF